MAKRPTPTRPEPEATESGGESTFVGRWARRTRLARAGDDPDAGPVESAEAGADEITNTVAAESGDDVADEPRELTDADMPPLESIDESTDMSGFLSPKVSEKLKRVALRKFFHSPMFNVVDGLDDYDDDFTTFEALGDIITSDMRGIAEQKEARAKEALAAEQGATEGGESAVEEARAADGGDETDASQGHEQVEDQGEETARASGEEAAEDSSSGVTRDPVASGAPKLRRKDDDGEPS